MTEATGTLDQLAIDTIRTLSMDAVQKANSGHPGAPMGMAPMAYTLWTRFLRHAPSEPTWPNRDRFLLSAGHASMLLYSLLYLTGYGLTLEDLQSFRQWGSLTPGHPEHGHTKGVEATTGAARPGLRQRRRHGHRPAPTGGRVQPARPRLDRPLRLRHLLRRRP
jgi:transketolase